MSLIQALWAEVGLCVFVMGLTVKVLIRRHRSRRMVIGYVLCMSSMMFFDAFVVTPISWTAVALPIVYDPALFRISALLGLADAKPLVALATHFLLVKATLYFIYMSLVHFVALGFSSEVAYRDIELKHSLFMRFVVVGVIGYGLYFLMPAVSPGVYFGANFPDNLPAVASVNERSVRLSGAFLWAPRNTMPSLHAAWVILCFIALWRSPLWHRCLGLILVICTFLATIGFGYHYLVDWVAAVPLVLLVRGLTADLPVRGVRGAAFVVGVLLLVLWVTTVRLSPLALQFPFFIKALAALSVFAPAGLELILYRATCTVGGQLAPTKTLQVDFAGISPTAGG